MFGIADKLGIDLDIALIVIAALIVVAVILLVISIVCAVRLKRLEGRYRIFMEGSEAKSLEDTLIKRLDQVDALISANKQNQRNIKHLYENNQFVFQKTGLVKYDAFSEMGGKLSFSVALLNEKNDGFIINAMHTREGCYTYIKEIIAGNSIIVLSDDEKKALDMALSSKQPLAGE